ncbi:MAG: indole-3-glycerol-phosphate synthase [Flavobacteriales bacterium]|nr:indole-3-glycerol-phosphate synthase [Flavobacteriales bacterium]
MNILNQLAASAKLRADELEKNVPLSSLEQEIQSCETSMVQSLRDARLPIIAEFKRASPSEGIIQENADLQAQIKSYEEMEIGGISVLTEETKFKGSLADLREASELTQVPLLRKDFIVTRYQVAEARINGASAILLISRILTGSQQENLIEYAHQLGMEVLLEIHHQDELIIDASLVDMLGVNCRDLTNFTTDTSRFKDLKESLPDHPCMIAESGMYQVSDLYNALDLGYHGALVGTALMRNKNTFQSFSREII